MRRERRLTSCGWQCGWRLRRESTAAKAEGMAKTGHRPETRERQAPHAHLPRAGCAKFCVQVEFLDDQVSPSLTATV